MPRRQKMKIVKNQNLGVFEKLENSLKMLVFEKEKEKDEDFFVGETRRDWREDEDKELII